MNNIIDIKNNALALSRISNRCLSAITLIQIDTPTREMIPLLEKRYLQNVLI